MTTHIVMTVYNCEQWIARSIQSLQSQTDKSWICHVLNDLSTDRTMDIMRDYANSDHRQRFVIYDNKEKLFQAGNYHQVMMNKAVLDEDICIELDGDDWFAHTKVLENAVKAYKDTGCWMTYGYPMYTTGERHPSKFTGVETLRTTQFSLSHLRSWKAFLWRNIKKEDLLHEGSWPIAGCDSFFMIPMAEMAGDDRICFIDDVNYIYNFHNPLNECKVDVQSQWGMAAYAKAKKPYTRLERD